MNRNLGLLLSGQLISQLGDKCHMLAVAYWVLKTTGSPAKMGVVLFASLFPQMLFGLISGAFIDRCNRKFIIVGADIIRGVVVAVLCVLYYFGTLSFPLLIAAQVLISVCTAFFDPAIPTIIPQIVKREQLTRANSQTQFVSGLAMIAGPVLGGLIVSWTGYLAVFIFNAASYLFSAAFESLIRLPALEKPISRQDTIMDDILAGYRYVYRRKHLVVILAMVGVIHFFVGSVEAVIPVLATALKGDGAANIGYIQSAFGLGLVLAALPTSLRTIDGKEIKLLFGSIFLMGILLLIISGVHLSGVQDVVPFLIFFFAIGGSVLLAATSFRSIIQKDTDDHMMGRLFGLVSCVGNISLPVAILVFGFFMEYVSHNVISAVSGLVLMPISFSAYCLFIRYASRKTGTQHLEINRCEPM